METSISGNYGRLQCCLDKVVSKLGVERTSELLENFVKNTQEKENSTGTVKIILPVLVAATLKVFELDENIFLTSGIRDYRDARFCCFHLLRKYSTDTISKIAIAFHSTERAVSYGCLITGERLDLPKFNKTFVNRYKAVETTILNFISSIN